jgi:hypothetical protein
MSLPRKRARLVKSYEDVAKELLLADCSCCDGTSTYSLLLLPTENGAGLFLRKGVIVDTSDVSGVKFTDCPAGAKHSNVSENET